MPTFWLNSQRTRNMAIDDHWKVNNAATAPRWNAAITAKNTQLNSSDLSCSNSTGREASSDCDSASRVDMGYPSRLSTDWLWVRTLAPLPDRTLPSCSFSMLRAGSASKIAHILWPAIKMGAFCTEIENR